MRGLSFFKSALAAGVMASVSGLSVAAPSFDFSLLHEPYVADGNASAINDAGDVVGRWPYATFWRNGVGLNLDDAFNGSSDVYGLNNLGDAVGHSGDGFGVATLWRNQIPTQLPTPEGWRSTAFDVNDAGYIVGMHEAIGSSGYPRAVVWQIDSMTELAMPDGATASFANAINNGGQIVGGSGHSANSSRATLWQEGEATLLQTLGGSISYANDINNLGQIAGASYLGNGGIGLHATLWTNGQVIDLGTLSGFLNSSANAVNDAGWVVGVSSTNNWYEDRATVWVDGAATDLNSFLDDDEISAGWVLRSAVDINRNGVIVGNAYNEFTGMSQVYLMTPSVPEPETWALLLTGFGITVLSASRRHRV